MVGSFERRGSRRLRNTNERLVSIAEMLAGIGYRNVSKSDRIAFLHTTRRYRLPATFDSFLRSLPPFSPPPLFPSILFPRDRERWTSFRSIDPFFSSPSIPRGWTQLRSLNVKRSSARAGFADRVDRQWSVSSTLVNYTSCEDGWPPLIGRFDARYITSIQDWIFGSNGTDLVSHVSRVFSKKKKSQSLPSSWKKVFFYRIRRSALHL